MSTAPPDFYGRRSQTVLASHGDREGRAPAEKDNQAFAERFDAIPACVLYSGRSVRTHHWAGSNSRVPAGRRPDARVP